MLKWLRRWWDDCKHDWELIEIHIAKPVVTRYPGGARVTITQHHYQWCCTNCDQVRWDPVEPVTEEIEEVQDWSITVE